MKKFQPFQYVHNEVLEQWVEIQPVWFDGTIVSIDITTASQSESCTVKGIGRALRRILNGEKYEINEWVGKLKEVSIHEKSLYGIRKEMDILRERMSDTPTVFGILEQMVYGEINSIPGNNRSSETYIEWATTHCEFLIEVVKRCIKRKWLVQKDLDSILKYQRSVLTKIDNIMKGIEK